MSAKKDKRAKRKVIGWTTYDEDDFVGNESGVLGYGGDDETDQAVAKDIKAHGYLFTGNDHQDLLYCVPVTDDYRMIRYATRHFGWVMAKAHGEDPRKAYSVYAWNYGWDSVKKVFPTGKRTVENLTPPPTEFEVPPDFFAKVNEDCSYSSQIDKLLSADKNAVLTAEEIDKYIDSIDDFNVSKKLFLVPVEIPKDSYYWINDTIKLNCGGDFLYTTVYKILAYENFANFEKDIEMRKTRGDNEYIYDFDAVKSAAAKGRFLLLGLKP